MADLDKILFAIPDNWVWGIEQPRIKGLVKIEGQRKPKPARYTAFVANEVMFGTKGYFSAFADSNSYEDALKQAFNDVMGQIARKRNEKVSTSSNK